MVTRQVQDIVVPWAIAEDGVQVQAAPAARLAPVRTGSSRSFDDHCPACGSLLVERFVSDLGPEIRCLSCARVWTVGQNGLRLHTRIIVDP